MKKLAVVLSVVLSACSNSAPASVSLTNLEIETITNSLVDGHNLVLNGDVAAKITEMSVLLQKIRKASPLDFDKTQVRVETFVERDIQVTRIGETTLYSANMVDQHITRTPNSLQPANEYLPSVTARLVCVTKDKDLAQKWKKGSRVAVKTNGGEIVKGRLSVFLITRCTGG